MSETPNTEPQVTDPEEDSFVTALRHELAEFADEEFEKILSGVKSVAESMEETAAVNDEPQPGDVPETIPARCPHCGHVLNPQGTHAPAVADGYSAPLPTTLAEESAETEQQADLQPPAEPNPADITDSDPDTPASSESTTEAVDPAAGADDQQQETTDAGTEVEGQTVESDTAGTGEAVNTTAPGDALPPVATDETGTETAPEATSEPTSDVPDVDPTANPDAPETPAQ